MPSVMARRETPVARATAETPPYPIASLSAAATKRRIRSSRKGDRERNRRWISLPGTSCSIKQIYPNLLYLFSDNPLFVDEDEYLDSDAVFGVKKSLIRTYTRQDPGVAPDGRNMTATWY